MDEEAFEDLLAANRIPRKGQEMFWTGRTHPLPAYLDECSNDSVMSTSSRLDESQAKLGEIADRLDSFFCEDDPILLPSSTLSTSDKSSENPTPGKEFCTTFLFFCLYLWSFSLSMYVFVRSAVIDHGGLYRWRENSLPFFYIRN